MKIWSSRWIDLVRYKSKFVLLSIIGERIPTLQPANKAKTFYKCICPFHNEKTPSMKFFFNKHISGWGYKCFGCGASGDVFTFLRRYENWEFWEAMLYVTKNHIPSSSYSTSPSIWIQLEIPFPNEELQDDLPF